MTSSETLPVLKPFYRAEGYSRQPLAVGLLLVFSAFASNSACLAQSSGWVQSGWRASPQAQAVPRQEIELKPVEDVGDKIEAGRETLQDGRISSERITDILVRLKPLVKTFKTPATATQSERSSTEVGVQIHVVSQGRISPSAAAQCNRFDGDILVCTVECEGGLFGLRRGRAPGEHFLIVGMIDKATASSATGGLARGGFRLGACAGREAPGQVVAPRGGRLSMDIRLFEQP